MTLSRSSPTVFTAVFVCENNLLCEQFVYVYSKSPLSYTTEDLCTQRVEQTKRLKN